MKKLDLIKMFFAAIVVAAGAWAQTIWDGTTDDLIWRDFSFWHGPDLMEATITTPAQLAGLAQLVNEGMDFAGTTITLGADILLNDTTDWKNWANTAPANKWTPIVIDSGKTSIGTDSAKAFSGTFDGAGFVVSGVYISDENNFAGLFGALIDADIKNLGVVASYIKGDNSIGGLAGYNIGGTITYENGTTIRYNNATITNCYATGNVSAEIWGGGGLVGYNIGGTITNCYATGNVSGTEIWGLGGLVGGGGGSGTITNCYYDSETSGQSTGRGAPKTTAEMKTQATFVGWDFYEIWDIAANINEGYPHFNFREFVAVSNISSIPTSATYGQTITFEAVIEPSGATKKTIVYSVVSGGGATINGNNITFTQVGQVTIRATIADGKKTVDYTKDFTITVAKANPTYTIPTNLTATVGQTLENVALPSGWSWEPPAALVGEVGARTHKAKYTPSDVANYNILTDIDVTVTVSAETSVSKPTKSGNGLGIIFEKTVVSDELKIVKVALPNGKEGKVISVVIYDNTGNVVFSDEKTKIWDLRNKSGRIVANGSYLVIVETKSGDKSYWYSAKIGVKK